MIDRTNDKKVDFSDLQDSIKKMLEHIKENFLVFFICFLISRSSVIGEMFPFSVIVLCTYCYLNGPSLAVLAITLLAINTVKLDFVYSVMLAAIYFYFYNFRNEKKKHITIVAAYSSAVLLCSKTSILIVDGFSTTGIMLNIFEAVFVFSSIVLAVELMKIAKTIKESGIKQYFHRPRVKKDSSDNSAEIEAASTSYRDEAKKIKPNYEYFKKEDARGRRLLNIFTERAKIKIKEQLLWENINVKYFEVISGTDDSIFLSVTLKTEKTPEKAEEAVIFAVRNLCGVKLKCTEKITSTPNYYVLKFKNIKRAKIKTYASTAVKDGSPLSGDSFTYAGKTDKYYAVLCDGIGSGEEAFNESNGAVDMLTRFLNTDFTEEQILKTLNSLLMLKLNEERYVTFDLQIIDYSSKEMRVYKAGTPPTYFIRGNSVEKIEGHSLPMGILESFEYNFYKRDIKKGDMVIMISDGIIDSINMDEKKSLEKFLSMIIRKDPQTIANLILAYALRGQKNVIDDMTVLVTKIG